MITFNLKNKGRVNQYFGGSAAINPANIYTSLGVVGHTGIDTDNGFNSPVPCDNSGLVYKIFTPDVSSEGYQAVCQIVDDGVDVVEVMYGHLNTLNVFKGQYINAGDIVGTQGNKGYVFAGALQITKAMQAAGDLRGHHLHTQYRPVKKVASVSRGKHYLNNINGTRYRDSQNNVYEVLFNDNGYKGCVNPLNYLQNKDTVRDNQLQQISLLQKVVALLKQLYNK